MIDKFSCGFINSVYDFNDYTLNELICKLAQKMDEVITQSNESFNYLEWLKEQGISSELQSILNTMLEDGSLKNLINQNLFNELNNAINEINSQMDTKANESEVNKRLSFRNFKPKFGYNCYWGGICGPAPFCASRPTAASSSCPRRS